MKACLVHGFNVKDAGAGTVDVLASRLLRENIAVDVDEADYGYFGLMDIRWRSGNKRRRVLHRLANAFAKADLIITHSNGAHFSTLAMEMLDESDVDRLLVVHISPALNRKTEPPAVVKRQLVLHTPHDKAVRISSYLLRHPWGRMGAYGYSGSSPKVRNEKHEEVKGHSDWFKVERHTRMTHNAILAFLQES